MRLRNNPNAREILEKNQNYVVINTNEYKGKWHELFNNDHPIYIEIGMGKGDYIIESAKRFPDINFIGIEKYPTVVVSALNKLKDQNDLVNLRFICEDASFLTDLFARHEISRIYLNFSDPWPKKKHTKRRLTYVSFLNLYKNILIDQGEIILKTDNRQFFEYSLQSFNQYGMDFLDICLDLHNDQRCEDNIETEYERKFAPMGPIYRCIVKFKGVQSNG